MTWKFWQLPPFVAPPLERYYAFHLRTPDGRRLIIDYDCEHPELATVRVEERLAGLTANQGNNQ